jgi:hypothetical protein
MRELLTDFAFCGGDLTRCIQLMVAFDMAQSECAQDLTDVNGVNSTRAKCALATKIEECGA